MHTSTVACHGRGAPLLELTSSSEELPVKILILFASILFVFLF